jgi:hypothetical protein
MVEPYSALWKAEKPSMFGDFFQNDVDGSEKSELVRANSYKPPGSSMVRV